MSLQQYIKEVNTLYQTGIANEHSYRPALQQLLSQLLPNLLVINEAKRIECGTPDIHIIEKSNMLPIAYFETKRIGDDDLVGEKGNKEQFDRYKNALNHIVFTDYLTFYFYNNGILIDSVRIGEIRDNEILPLDDNLPCFEKLITDIASKPTETIKSATVLAEKMAKKARMLEFIVGETLKEAIKNKVITDSEEESVEDYEDLVDLYEAFKTVLIDQLDPETFADLYAQTVTYGFFVSRLRCGDEYKEFSRLSAGIFIPKTYPLLKQIFTSLTSSYVDESFAWIIDDLVSLFRSTDIKKLLESYYNNNHRNDPMIRFYEDFLKAYDPKKKDLCGVYYTPEQIVSFMVNSVDCILKSHFNLPTGLADFSKTTCNVIDEDHTDVSTEDGFARKQKEYHRVQILDPATGTGTFLAETIKTIHHYYENEPSAWQEYVESELFPRLNGFEFMMAPYSVAHIKIDMLLRETGFKHTGKQRLNIYLADSLKAPNSNPIITNFAYKLSREVKKADRIKRNKPIMVMMGNPPYNGESVNRGEWIMNLLNTYKREPEKSYNIEDTKWLNDDYVKFIRLAQNYIERGGTGIVAYINPHGYLFNPTFRGMRYELLKAYDEILIINLHGNSKKKENSPNGEKDENVFNIQQGICINFFIKTGKKAEGELGKVRYADVWGRKREKLDFLKDRNIEQITFKEIYPTAPRYFFIPMDTQYEQEFFSGMNISETFAVGGVGMCTKRDKIAYQEEEKQMRRVLTDFKDLPEDRIKSIYKINSESRDQKVAFAKKNVISCGIKDHYIKKALYRPFDVRYTYFTNKSKGFIAYPVYDVMHHLADSDNIGLIVGQQGQVVGGQQWNLAFATDKVTDMNIFYRGGGYVYPLFITDDISNETIRYCNIKEEVRRKIDSITGVNTDPKDIFAYIYAVLYSNYYRQKFAPFLEYYFPHIPYPNADTFTQIVSLGHELLELHLMRKNLRGLSKTKFLGEGNNIITTIKHESLDNGEEVVRINNNQYFSNISSDIYNYHIGGYQTLFKWLKDRSGKKLSFTDISHFEDMVYIIARTRELSDTIDIILNNKNNK